MYDKITVRLVDVENDKMIRVYDTVNLSETLKMYEHMIENDKLDISIPIQDREDGHNDEYGGRDARVRGVDVNFGDNEYCLLSINVYVEVY